MGNVRVFNPKEQPTKVQHPYSFTEQFLNFDFNIYEYRIILRILQLIKSAQKRNAGIQIDIENNVELLFQVDHFIVPGHKNHNDIKDAIIALREKTIAKNTTLDVEIDGSIVTVDGHEFMGLIERPVWSNNNAFVKFKLNEVWFRYLSDVSKGYTQYLVDVAFVCSSTNTLKMYLFINQWFKSKGKTLSVENFRNEFSIPDSYSISKIVERILEPARTELDAISDRSFNYKFHYADGSERDAISPLKGKKVHKVSFVFYTVMKNKSVWELSDHEHVRAQRFLNKIEKRYSLSEEHRKLLYGLFKMYSLPVFVTSELENREILSKFKGKDFIDKIYALTVAVKKIEKN